MKKILALMLALLMMFSMAAVTVGAEGGTDAVEEKKGIYEIPDGEKTVTIKDRHGVDQVYTVVRTFQELIDAVDAANEEVETEPVMTENADGTTTQTGVKIVNEMTCRFILANDLDCEGQVFDRAPLVLYRVASWTPDPLKPEEKKYVSGDDMATYIFEGNGFAIKNLSVINTTTSKTENGSAETAVYHEDVEASIFGCATPNHYEISNLDFGSENAWVKISSMYEGACNAVVFQRIRTGASLYMNNVNIYADIEVNNAQDLGGIGGTANAEVEICNVNVYGSIINRRKDASGAGVGNQGAFFGLLQGNFIDGYACNHYFENCSNWATIEATNNSGGFGGYLGGRWELVNCRNYGQITTVTGTSTNINAGGFLAHTNDLIANPTGNVATPNSEGKTYKNDYDVDGVKISQAVYRNCLNLAPITGGQGRTGGFQGCDRRANIYENCINYGIITGNQWTGGFAGFCTGGTGISDAYATYRNCINYGRVVAAGNNQGGFIGALGVGAYFYNCLNVGEVIQSGTAAGDHIGGFAGYAPSTAPLLIENSTNIGAITANTLSGGKGGFFADCQSTLNLNGAYQFGYITSSDSNSADGNFGHFVGTDRGGVCLYKEGSSFSGNYAIDNAYSIANGISKINEYGVTPIAAGETVSETYVTPDEAVDMLNERYEEIGLVFRINEATGMPMLAAPALRAVQHTDPEGDKQDIRLIGTLYSLDYKSAGFKVVVSYVDGEGETVTGDETTLTSSKVYKTICASDGGVLTNYSADKMLGVYLYALTIKDVPTNVGEVKITVTPVATIDNNGADEVYIGSAYVITYNNGEYVGTAPYVAPAQ